MQRSPQNFAARIVEFCRFARECGLSAAVKESVDALRAVQAAGVSDREALKMVLRSVLCSSKEEWDFFEELFGNFWRAEDRTVVRSHQPSLRRSAQPVRPQRANSAPALQGQSGSGKAETETGKAMLGATVFERLKRVDFSEIPRNDLADLEQISLRLLRQMSLRMSRRLKTSSPSGRVDLRRTIRRSIGRGGEPLDLSFKDRKRQRSRLVILLDISGSMNAYSLFLLKFAYVLQRHFRQVNTFLFSTRLEEITAALRYRGLSEALESLAQLSSGWSGGTKIGESLGEFNRLHARRALSRETLFIVFSDGWDTGDPEVLAAELAAIKRRVRRVIWLNPLLGMSDYRPVTRGMSAALPWIDVFAPAHNLESLLELERRLARR